MRCKNAVRTHRQPHAVLGRLALHLLHLLYPTLMILYLHCALSFMNERFETSTASQPGIRWQVSL